MVIAYFDQCNKNPETGVFVCFSFSVIFFSLDLLILPDTLSVEGRRKLTHSLGNCPISFLCVCAWISTLSVNYCSLHVGYFAWSVLVFNVKMVLHLSLRVSIHVRCLCACVEELYRHRNSGLDILTGSGPLGVQFVCTYGYVMFLYLGQL